MMTEIQVTELIRMLLLSAGGWRQKEKKIQHYWLCLFSYWTSDSQATKTELGQWNLLYLSYLNNRLKTEGYAFRRTTLQRKENQS